MKLKVRHYWEEDNNKNLGKTLGNCYGKDPCLVKKETNTIIYNEGEQNNKLEEINNENSTLHLSDMGTGISENSTGEEVTEHIEENLKDNARKRSEEVQIHQIIEHIKEISKKEAKEKFDKIHKEQGIGYIEERKDENVIDNVKKIQHKEIINEEINTNNKTITFEDIKTKLGALSKGGKHKEVKELLNKYGFSKITEMSKEYYEVIFREAERF